MSTFVIFLIVAAIFIGLVLAAYFVAEKAINALPGENRQIPMIELQVAARMRDVYKIVIVLIILAVEHYPVPEHIDYSLLWLTFLIGTFACERFFRYSLMKKYVPSAAKA